MPEVLKIPDTPEDKAKTSVTALVAGAVVVLAMAGSFWFLSGPPQSKKGLAGQGTGLRMSDAEREYARNLRFENVGLSRAENFLRQEVTTLNGEVVNGGAQAVLGLFVTAEFSDDLNQVVLRETRGVLGAPAAALAPGQRRAFEISFEHVPSSWNHQQPNLRVASLELPAQK